MLDNYLIEIFSELDFCFIDKAVTGKQKYEFDYMSIVTNTITIPGKVIASKRNYIQISAGSDVYQGVIVAVEYTKKETKIQYKNLMHLLDVDVYKERTELQVITAEDFIGQMIEDNLVSNSDDLQNIYGLTVECTSETDGARLNLVDNIHNIYDIAVKAFKKYEIVVSMEFDVMQKTIRCTIGTLSNLDLKHIEADLPNVLEVDVTIKESDTDVNKVVVIGEYPEGHELNGNVLLREFYLDAETGEVSTDTENRVTPVVFKYKVIEINEESFEGDARDAAADTLYREKYDNSIKIVYRESDTLQNIKNFLVGQKCIVIKKGIEYETVFTGWTWNKTVRLQFGILRTEYSKNIRRVKIWPQQ